MALTLKSYALYLLSRREYSFVELRQKLIQKNYATEEIAAVMGELKEKKLQSDDRYAEMLIRARTNHGFGPLRIRAELISGGVEDSVICQHLEGYQDEEKWEELAKKAREKKFGKQLPSKLSEKIKQQKYLQYKGFDLVTIAKIFKQGNFVMSSETDYE